MLLSNSERSGCDRGDELVSYLFDEISRTDREKFDRHLSSCAFCTSGLAGMSNVKSALSEWRREEFEVLATPSIEIPKSGKNRRPSGTDVNEKPRFGGILGWAGFRNWSPLTAAFAAIIAVFGLGLLALSIFNYGKDDLNIVGKDSKPTEIASNVSSNEPHNIAVTSLPADDSFASKEPSEDSADITGGSFELENSKTREANGKRHITEHPAGRVTKVVSGSQTRNSPTTVSGRKNIKNKAPVLSSFEDEDDDSLRLADLFDQIGTD